MAYTPPSSDNVELIIETGYTPPNSSNVELIVGAVEYTISLSDGIQLSHADKRDLSLSPKEVLTLIDSLRYHSILIKPLSDGILLYETIDKQADLYNAILNLISLSENKKDKTILSLKDILTLNTPSYSRIIFPRFFNSIITTVKELYSLIKKEEEL